MELVDPAALEELMAFLPCPTPEVWIQEALKQQEILLLNHCYLEQCAARTIICPARHTVVIHRVVLDPDIQVTVHIERCRHATVIAGDQMVGFVVIDPECVMIDVDLFGSVATERLATVIRHH